MSSIVTTIGTNKLATATPLDQLEIIQIAVGDGNGTTPTLNPSQTALVNELWRGGVSTPIKGTQENIVIFEGFIPQNIGGFTIREVGIFDPAGDLIAVGTTAEVEKPDPATETAITMRIRLHVALESTSDINLIAQDQGVFDHQGATNRDATDAHPASSISTAELTALALSASDVQSVLNNLKNAALRAMGTATDEVPDNAQLNTRLGTIGNLGDAAQRNMGTGLVNIPDNAELNTRLGTSGNLGDAALLTKQTSTSDATPGRSAIVGSFGNGGNAISVTNFDNITAGGLYYNGSGGATIGAPESGFIFVWHMQTATVGADVQIAISQASGNMYHRKRSGASSWGSWHGDDAALISFYATTVAPPGYIKANGAAVSRTAYARLFAKVGTFWGAGDGSTTFNVPDLRGEFIRAWDDGRGVDSGRSFGSFQDHELESHSHTLPSSTDNNTQNGFVQAADGTGTARTAITGLTGGTETRPRNYALLAYIKY